VVTGHPWSGKTPPNFPVLERYDLLCLGSRPGHKDYYTLNFGATAPGEIQLVVFLDLNETGGGELNNTLGVLDIILNSTSVQGNPDPSLEGSSAPQAAIDRIFTGGSVLVELSPEPAGEPAAERDGRRLSRLRDRYWDRPIHPRLLGSAALQFHAEQPQRRG
jgi:hypothetical protein